MIKTKKDSQPSWSRIKKTLAVGGLGFWQITRDARGDIFIRLDETFLPVLGLEESKSRLFPFKEYLDAYLPPPDQEIFRAMVEKLLDGECENFDGEHRIVAPRGRGIWVRTFGDAVFRDAGGQAVTIDGFIQNITHSKHLSQKRQAAIKTIVQQRNAIKLQMPETGIRPYSTACPSPWPFSTAKANGPISTNTAPRCTGAAPLKNIWGNPTWPPGTSSSTATWSNPAA